jgi:hypothetical protein
VGISWWCYNKKTHLSSWLFITLSLLNDYLADITTTTGSMADVPKDLLQEIKKLEQHFTIDTPKLKQITDHFVSELKKGTCTLI